MSGPPDLAGAVMARLRSDVPALVSVQGAADLAALIEQKLLPQRFPAAFVLELGEDGGPAEQMTGALRQQVTAAIGVVLLHRDAGDATGERARGRLAPVANAVRDVLLGWTPAGAATAFAYLRRRLLGLQAGTVFQQADFACTYWLRKVV